MKKRIRWMVGSFVTVSAVIAVVVSAPSAPAQDTSADAVARAAQLRGSYGLYVDQDYVQQILKADAVQPKGYEDFPFPITVVAPLRRLQGSAMTAMNPGAIAPATHTRQTV